VSKKKKKINLIRFLIAICIFFLFGERCFVHRLIFFGYFDVFHPDVKWGAPLAAKKALTFRNRFPPYDTVILFFLDRVIFS